MMKVLRTIRNYICYCGIEKNEYNELKKEAYVSNFEVWRVLHCFMAVVFAALSIASLKLDLFAGNRLFYLAALAYSVAVACLFLFVFDKKSIVAQLIIYLSISLLFVFAALITQNNPGIPATTFIVFLLITPLFMIDKPYFMAIELGAASVIFLVWMHAVKPYEVWRVDVANIIIFSIIGFFIHVISNSIRIREFVLARKLNIQKDTDELTGLKNKGALTGQINEYLADETKDKGIMLLLDINHFKSVNDTYGHDVGDTVINQLGVFLEDTFRNGDIVGRFGGDEFIVFIKDTDSAEAAESAARRIIEGTEKHIRLPDKDKTVSVSVGAALYHGEEKNYSEIFKKADVALYKTKTDRTLRFAFYSDSDATVKEKI